MASLTGIFDGVGVEGEQRDFEPLPAGWYKVEVTKADLKDTKDGTGKYIAVCYKVIGDKFANRLVFGNLNIKNKSADAERIGAEQFCALRMAAGLGKITDTDQLIGAVLEIDLKVKPATDQYPAGNDLKGFRAVVGSSMPASVASANTPPWAKKA